MKQLCYILILLFGSLSIQSQNVVFTDSNLPIFVINTQNETIPNEPKITAHLGVIDNGLERNYLSNDYNAYDGSIGIEVRGNGTADLEKTSYLFETRKEDGSNDNVELLGMPSENDWILYAPYIDKSLVRNVLTYDLAMEMGMYASRSRFCEVILNGEYLGVFVLMEKIKRDKNRVAVTKFPEDDPSAENGGYIVRIDSWWNEVLGWISNTYEVNDKERTVAYQYVYPKHDEITEDQKEYIREIVTDFEEDLNAAPKNSSDTYLEHIDLNSFVDYFIINEYGKNPDAYRLSTYFSYDPTIENPRLKMGPVWDHNHCYGSYAVYENKFSKWEYDNHWWDFYGHIPFWWNRFMEDSLFVETFSDRWFDYRADLLDCEKIALRIDEWGELLEEAQERNFTRWPIIGVNEPFDWNAGPTYQDELTYLKEWICNRSEWMDLEINRLVKSLDEDYLNTFPNPTSGKFNISFRSAQIVNWKLSTFTLDGKMLNTQSITSKQGLNTIPVEFDNLAAGVYLLHLSDGIHFLTDKLIIVP